MFFLKKIMEPIVFNGDPTVQIDRQPAFARSGSKIKIYPVQTKTYTQLTNSFTSVVGAPNENLDETNLEQDVSKIEELNSPSNNFVAIKTIRTSPDGDDSM
jgi:hypothetical protein